MASRNAILARGAPDSRVADLPAKWRAEAKNLEAFAATAQAVALHRAADELQSALRTEKDEQLTLTEASRESGYSPDHLGRLMREGKLANVGRRNAPRVRRADLPMKPGALPSGKLPRHIDRAAIARAVVNLHVGDQ